MIEKKRSEKEWDPVNVAAVMQSEDYEWWASIAPPSEPRRRVPTPPMSKSMKREFARQRRAEALERRRTRYTIFLFSLLLGLAITLMFLHRG